MAFVPCPPVQAACSRLLNSPPSTKSKKPSTSQQSAPSRGTVPDGEPISEEEAGPGSEPTGQGRDGGAWGSEAPAAVTVVGSSRTVRIEDCTNGFTIKHRAVFSHILWAIWLAQCHDCSEYRLETGSKSSVWMDACWFGSPGSVKARCGLNRVGCRLTATDSGLQW